VRFDKLSEGALGKRASSSAVRIDDDIGHGHRPLWSSPHRPSRAFVGGRPSSSASWEVRTPNDAPENLK
jgi:hypothetical protein